MVGILGPGPFKVRGACFHPVPPPLQAYVPGQGPRYSSARLRHHRPHPGPMRKDPFVSGDSGPARRDRADRSWDPGLVTYPSPCKRFLLPRVAFDSFLPSLFPSLLLSSFFCFFLVFFTPYFFLASPLLHFCFVFGLSVSSYLSPPPLLLNSSFLRGPGLTWGEPGGGVLFFFCALN